jgi:hypothetical protein
MRPAKTITITATPRQIRAMVTKAIRVWGGMNRSEEQTIEDAFLDIIEERAEKVAGALANSVCEELAHE